MEAGLVSKSGVWNPINNGDNKLVGGPGEYINFKLVSGNGSAFVSIYDAADLAHATSSNKRWVLDSASQSLDSDQFDPPLSFLSGLYMIMEEGQGTNPTVCFARRAMEV